MEFTEEQIATGVKAYHDELDRMIEQKFTFPWRCVALNGQLDFNNNFGVERSLMSVRLKRITVYMFKTIDEILEFKDMFPVVTFCDKILNDLMLAENCTDADDDKHILIGEI